MSSRRVHYFTPVVVGASLGLITGLVILAMLVPPIRASHQFASPTWTVADAARTSAGCSRCMLRVDAEFSTAGGSRVTTRLAGVGSSGAYYRPGVPLVYDAVRPARAMARSDYDSGRSASSIVIAGLGALLTLVSLATLVGVVRSEYRRPPRRASNTRRGSEPGHLVP